jgi:cardiolipin synthase
LRRLPNLISVARIVLIVCACILFFAGWRLGCVLLGIPAGLSDHLDGWLARRRNECTELGAQLDTLADLLYQLICFCIATYSGVWPTYLLVVWGVRDIGVTVLRASSAQQGFSLPSSLLAKVAINFNYYAFLVMGLDAAQIFSSPQLSSALHWFGLWAIHVGLALQWISGAQYLNSYARQYRGSGAKERS